MSRPDTDTDERRVTRRRLVQVAGASAVPSAFVNVVQADTDSGHVELETTATVPSDTSVEITVYEDTDGSGSANRQQTESIPDGTTTTEYQSLESITGEGTELWLELSLVTGDDETTPSVDSATLTLPETVTTPEPGETPSQDPQGIGGLWESYNVFVAFITLAFAVIGMWSKALTLGAWGGYLAFLYIAFTTGTPLYENIALVTLVLVMLGFAFKLVRLEFGSE